MKKKVLFFDIDGTLINFEGKLSASTKEAILLAKQNGHKTVLCTGRSRFQIYDSLLEMNFDGIIGAAGAYVEAEGKQIYHHTLALQPFQKLLDYFDQKGTLFMLQTTSSGVTTPDGAEKLTKLLEKEMQMPIERINRLFGMTTLDANVSERQDVEKLMYYGSSDNLEEVRKAIPDYFGLTAFSFDSPVESRGEITCQSETKASGMEHYLDHVSADVSDTVAFGDGPNDFDMMQYAEISVAMGNASDALKQKANMVTDSVNENGIYNAMKKLKLI